MNKGGFSFLLTLMLSITIIVLGMALITPLDKNNRDIRGENNTALSGVDDLDSGKGLFCDNVTVDDYTKGACIISDLFTPLYFSIMLGLAGLIIGARIIFS